MHVKGVHAQIKAKICEECGRGFRDQRDLRKHKKGVHKGKTILELE